MGSILDNPKKISIRKKYLHCVPIQGVQDNYVYIRKNTTNRCYFSDTEIDGKHVSIIFVSNGLEVQSNNRRARKDNMIKSLFRGVRHQNYNTYYVGVLDGKRYIVAIADKYTTRCDGILNEYAMEIEVQQGKTCTVSLDGDRPYISIEEEDADDISIKDVIEKVVSYEEMTELTEHLDEILRLHTEIEKIDPSFFLPEELKGNSHPCGDELNLLYQRYLEAVSRCSKLADAVKANKSKTDFQEAEIYLNFLTAENLIGDMSIAKYFVCERRSPDDNILKIHALGPRDETVIVRIIMIK